MKQHCLLINAITPRDKKTICKKQETHEIQTKDAYNKGFAVQIQAVV
jgi:hypothetical protein